MKTYISLLGTDISQFFSLIVKYGIEKTDKIIIIKLKDESNEHDRRAVQEIGDLVTKINKSIKVDVHEVDHFDFNSMLLSVIGLLDRTETKIIANLSGGSRELFLAFSIACMIYLDKIIKVVNYSDADQELKEISLPYIVGTMDVSLDERLIELLEDIKNHEPTTASEIADRLQVTKSTISRNLTRLKGLRAIDVDQQGKTKSILTTTTGEIILNNHLKKLQDKRYIENLIKLWSTQEVFRDDLFGNRELYWNRRLNEIQKSLYNKIQEKRSSEPGIKAEDVFDDDFLLDLKKNTLVKKRSRKTTKN